MNIIVKFPTFAPESPSYRFGLFSPPVHLGRVLKTQKTRGKLG